jgi:hypothetical protein
MSSNENPIALAACIDFFQFMTKSKRIKIGV